MRGTASEPRPSCLEASPEPRASGDLQVSLPAPLLAPGADVARLAAQGLYLVPATSEVFHGGPSVLVLLDESL